MKKHLIVKVIEDSPAFLAGIKKGETLVSLNGREITDIFDYDFIAEDDHVSLVVEDEAGA